MQDWNSFRRVEAAFNRQIPDRVPKFEAAIEILDLNPIETGQTNSSAILFFTPQVIDMFHNSPSFLSQLENIVKDPRSLQSFTGGPPKKATRLYKQYNYDMYIAVPGAPMVFKDKIFKDFYSEENKKVIRGPDGRLVWRTSPDGAHTRHGFMQDPKDWEKYLEFNPDHPGNVILVKSTVEACKKLDIVPIFFVFGCAFFEELSGMFGFETLFKLLIKDKPFIKEVVKTMSDYSIAVGEKIVEEGGNYLYMTNDIGFKGKSIISPIMFRELFKPGIKKFCGRMHELGGKVMMHSDGYIEELLPDFIDAKIDALHPIEKDAGNDIVEIKKKFGKDLTLIGNVPIPLLSYGTPKENYDYVLYLLDNVSKEGGHIISSSHSLTQWCKLENFLAYQKAVEDYGKYPIRIPH
jgi:uroporphyrinogen-III decarboxylase